MESIDVQKCIYQQQADFKHILTAIQTSQGIVKNLKTCVNLVPAHTGTTSVFEQLKRYSAHAHHNHFYFPNSSTPDCVFITLRDPLERLLSAFAHQKRRYNPQHRLHTIFGAESPEKFLQNIMINNTSMSANLFRMALAYTPSNDMHKMLVGSGGSGTAALLPQIMYWNTNKKIRVLCTNRLEYDWNRFTNLSYDITLKNNTHSNSKTSNLTKNSSMSKFLYECMYPYDYNLYVRFCGESKS